MKQPKLQKLVMAAMLCASVYAGSWIMIPLPMGNINIGDSILLLGAWMLGTPWASIAAGTGAALCDLTSGFAAYAPGTFLIKVLTALTAAAVFRMLRNRMPRLSRPLSSVIAELIMTAGYFLYEALLLSYGVAAAASIPFNLMQAAVCILVSNLAYKILTRKRH